MSEKPEPSAEDWIIFRLLNAWPEDAGSLGLDPTTLRTLVFMVRKLGKDTVFDMAKQLEEESKHERRHHAHRPHMDGEDWRLCPRHDPA